MNRIDTPTPFETSASVVATFVCNSQGPAAVWTVSPVHLVQQVDHRGRAELGEPVLAPRARPASPRPDVRDVDALAVPSREPPLDRRVEVGGRGRRMQQVDRVQRPGLRTGRHGGERRRVHQQHPGPAGPGGHRAHPHEDRHGQVHELLRQRDAVLPDRARAVELQHDHRALGDGLVEVRLEVPHQGPVDRPLHLDHVDGVRRGIGRLRLGRDRQGDGDGERKEKGHGTGHARPIVPRPAYPPREPLSPRTR